MIATNELTTARTPALPKIHSTSIIEDTSRIADDVEIGPHCVIRGPVKIGPGCRLIGQAYLTGPLTLASPAGGATQASDQDIQSAFLAAGEQALPAPAASSITIYWIPGSGGSYVPHCVLLDCTEPLWRWRQEPTLTAPDPGDPSFEIVQVAPATALEVIEDTGGGTASISGFLYSTSGTKTIAFLVPGFAPPASGTTVQLALHRPQSQAFTIADHVAPIIGLVIGPTAPWEADDV